LINFDWFPWTTAADWQPVRPHLPEGGRRPSRHRPGGRRLGPEIRGFVDRGLDDQLAAVDPGVHVLRWDALDISSGEVVDCDGTMVGISQRRPRVVAARQRVNGRRCTRHAPQRRSGLGSKR
jgi:hypothetical protein